MRELNKRFDMWCKEVTGNRAESSAEGKVCRKGEGTTSEGNFDIAGPEDGEAVLLELGGSNIIHRSLEDGEIKSEMWQYDVDPTSISFHPESATIDFDGGMLSFDGPYE